MPDVEKFMAEYNMQCPMAAKRLIYSGMPATVEHGKPRCEGMHEEWHSLLPWLTRGDGDLWLDV